MLGFRIVVGIGDWTRAGSILELIYVGGGIVYYEFLYRTEHNMHLITHFYEDLGDINFDMSVDF
jgi:hypothetical protein